MPQNVQDGRVLGGYIELILQTCRVNYEVEAFNKDEVVYRIDRTHLTWENTYLHEPLVFMWNGIADEAAWKEAVKETADRFGGVDALINNAGCSAHVTLMDSTVELWRTVLEENLIGHWLGIREVVPYMRERGGGSIVNCCSNTALQGGDVNAAAYCSAKGGLRSLTKHAAMVLGKDSIRVNAVHPGPILTGLALKYMPDMTPAMLGKSFQHLIPLPPSAGEASDIAYAYLYLASDESKFVTGQDLPVDGGWSAGYVPFQ